MERHPIRKVEMATQIRGMLAAAGAGNRGPQISVTGRSSVPDASAFCMAVGARFRTAGSTQRQPANAEGDDAARTASGADGCAPTSPTKPTDRRAGWSSAPISACPTGSIGRSAHLGLLAIDGYYPRHAPHGGMGAHARLTPRRLSDNLRRPLRGEEGMPIQITRGRIAWGQL